MKIVQILGAAAEAVRNYLEERQLHSAEKTYITDRERSGALNAFFGATRLSHITPEMVVRYQAERRRHEVSGRTINLEVGLLRRVLKRYKQWGRLAEDVRMLPEHPKAARVLSPEEKIRLVETANSKPEWQTAYCAVVLALNTTMRGCELKGLTWQDVDLLRRVLRIRRASTKTDAGARTIPINQDALAVLRQLHDRAQTLGCSEKEHFVFPACENGHIDPTRPIRSWRTAWRSITRAAGLEGLRFHDLRHHAITELAERSSSDQTIMSIAGHVGREMLDHYSHIRLEAKRKALESLETRADHSRREEEADAEVEVARIN